MRKSLTDGTGRSLVRWTEWPRAREGVGRGPIVPCSPVVRETEASAKTPLA